MELLRKTVLLRTVAFLVFLALVIFVPALSPAYWQGWAYWLVFSAATLASGLYFVTHDPALVQRRMQVGATAEREPVQKTIMAAASIFLIAVFVTSGIDHLRQWSRIPAWLSLLALAGMTLGYGIIVVTLKANTFAASTIAVEPGQHVVSSGPYAVVRHPMYSGAIVMFMATPIALASWWGLLPALLLSAAIVARLLHEERVLSRQLPGYDDYQRRVRSRLLPGIW